jgi:hypothetical protein
MSDISLLTSEIESRTLHIEILLNAMTEKIDASTDPKAVIEAVDCFITCALRNVALLKEHYTALASTSLAVPLDQWIKVTQETLPSDQLHVDVFMPGDDSVERAFYDADAKAWTDTCDGNTYIDGAITHWRIGSRPSMARGSACDKGDADA